MPPDRAERIAVTGVGVVSALGPDADTSFSRLIAGERGFGPVTLFDVSGQRSGIAAEIRGLRTEDVAPAGKADAWSRSDAMAVVAARDALAHAGIAGAPLSVAIGATTGGMFEAEGVLVDLRDHVAPDASARRLLSYPLSTTAERIAEALGPVERAVTVCSACSSSTNAIVQGAAWIAGGRAERVLAGGTDGLCRLTYTGFGSLAAVDPEPCRPFDVSRAGLGLGEGAAFLVLEPERVARARGATILGWLSGWSIAAEAHHVTHPDPSGATPARLMREALARAGLEPADIDYVNAHGTGTIQNDAMEARALAAALGGELERVRVSSSKGQVGHTLGAAGALEAAFSVLALDRGVAPPTGGLETPDPELKLRHVIGRGERAGLRAALSSSFGFGGTGSVLAFERADMPDRRPSRSQRTTLLVTGIASFGPAGVLSGADNAVYGEAPTFDEVSAEPLALLEPARSRRFDRAAAMVAAGAHAALGDAALAPEGVGLVAGTAYGNVQRSVQFLRRIAERGARMASPADFPHLVPSAPSGNASIYLGLTGPVVSISDLDLSAEASLALAADWLDLGLAPAMLAGSAEPRDPIVERVLGPLCVGERSVPRGEGSAWLVLEPEANARARGARALARIVQRVERWCAPEQALEGVAGPDNAERSVVVLGAGGSLFAAALTASAWAHAQKLSVPERVGAHEAVGGFALAVAVAKLARGDADDALVCSSSRGHTHLVRFERAG